MEIKRIFEELVVTKRRFVIRQMPSGKQTACAECGEPMLPIAQAAVLLSIKQSRIFQIIETKQIHFIETEDNAILICLTSLTTFLEADDRK